MECRRTVLVSALVLSPLQLSVVGLHDGADLAEALEVAQLALARRGVDVRLVEDVVPRMTAS